MDTTLHLLAVLAVCTLHQSSLAAYGAGCPDIPNCHCNKQQMLWCNGSADALDSIVEGLKTSPAAGNLTILDLSLTNLTIIRSDFFDKGLAAKVPLLRGIYISSGPVTQVEDGAFSGIDFRRDNRVVLASGFRPENWLLKKMTVPRRPRNQSWNVLQSTRFSKDTYY